MAKAFQKGLAETYHYKHTLLQSELWNSCMIIIWPFLGLLTVSARDTKKRCGIAYERDRV